MFGAQTAEPLLCSGYTLFFLKVRENGKKCILPSASFAYYCEFTSLGTIRIIMFRKTFFQIKGGMKSRPRPTLKPISMAH